MVIYTFRSCASSHSHMSGTLIQLYLNAVVRLFVVCLAAMTHTLQYTSSADTQGRYAAKLTERR